MKTKFFILLGIVLLIITGCSNNKTQTKSNQDSKVTQPEIVKVMLKRGNSENFYVVTTADGNHLKYAYYVYKDHKVVKKVPYRKDAYFEYRVSAPGEYKVKVFIKDSTDKTVSKYTDTVKMK